MGGFKLIGLIPLDGCSKRFLKNLEVGEKYCFYQQYDIELNEKNTSIQSVQLNSKFKREKNLSLYNNSNEINVSISALVGENGSGKSSLIELLYYAVYFIGTRYKNVIKDKEDEFIVETSEVRINHLFEEIKKNQKLWRLKSIKGEDREILLARLVKRYGIHVLQKGKKKSMNDFIKEKLVERRVDLNRRIRATRKIERDIDSKLNLALVYETDKIHCIEINGGKFTHVSFENGKRLEAQNLKEFDLQDFFYSISVNYSHHSLNSASLGEWINTLFHKNDGYQTPVVINPMRDEGNFNVNHETHLLKERLAGNIAYNLYTNPNYLLLDKYRFENFIYTPKRNSGEETVGVKPMIELSSSYFKNDPIGKILHCKGFSSLTIDRITEKALAYLDKKVFRIPEQYPFLFKTEITRENHEELVSFINKDDTHITKKIFQTILFLHSHEKRKNLWTMNSKHQIVLNRSQMIDWLKVCAVKIIEDAEGDKMISPYDFSLFSHPGFMNVDFEIRDLEKRKTFKLSELSSGEQQIILNLSSISYHLHNLQSIHTSDKERIKYENINIFLDEIELYYHPNSQRKMVSEMLTTVKEISKLNTGIQSVNIIFSTHSPFILSDIPNQNILRLENGKPSKRKFSQTFGANIHDLLANDFFLKDAFMGGFAMSKINEVIERLQGETQEITTEEQEEMKSTIELVGEDILRNSLFDLFSKKLKEPSYNELKEFYNQNQHGTNK